MSIDHPFGTVLLQAMKEEPPIGAKCKDKFLVQSVAVTGDMEYSNVTAIVRLFPGTDLNVVFLYLTLTHSSTGRPKHQSKSVRSA